MGREEQLPSGLLLTTVEKWAPAHHRREDARLRTQEPGVPAIFGLACCAIEPFQAGGAWHFDAARAHVPGVDALVSSDAARHENTRTVTRQPLAEGSGMS